MYHYQMYGLSISSDIDIPYLIEGASNDADVIIRRGDIPDFLRGADSAPYYSVAKDEAWFHNSTGFFYMREGKYINYLERENSSTHYDIRAFLTGYAISIILMQRGYLAIHCSAVYGLEGAVIISGGSGAGKSTLTSRFLERGYKLMADDIAAVRFENGGAYLYPAFPYQKLCRNVLDDSDRDMEDLIYIDEEKDKYLVPAEHFHNERAKVSRMLVISQRDIEELNIYELSGMDKLTGLQNNMFLHELTGPWQSSPEFLTSCLVCAGAFPITRIERPKGKDTLSEIESHVIPK